MEGREGKEEDGNFRLDIGRRGVCFCASVVSLYTLSHTHTPEHVYMSMMISRERSTTRRNTNRGEKNRKKEEGCHST